MGAIPLTLGGYFFFYFKICLGVRKQTTESWKVLAAQRFGGKHLTLLSCMQNNNNKKLVVLQLNICICEFLSCVRQGIF